MKKNRVVKGVLALVLLGLGGTSSAVSLEELAAKLDDLSSENIQLRQRIDELEANRPNSTPPPSKKHTQISKVTQGNEGVVRVNHDFSYDMLDATTRINSKQRLLLENKKEGHIDSNTVYLSGAVTGIADYQTSNTDGKFGYLMRHPTANNQRTKSVSEALIHSAQIGITANLGDWVSGYVELLYDPEQSFGQGTNTALGRNQVQVRRGYVLLGNLDKSPAYLSLGKMAIPFGLTDTVNPFTASSHWHAFGGLAYGINAGYTKNNLNFNFMGVQGGAQFRGANTSVDNSSVPSKLNNLAVDLNYTFDIGYRQNILFGASYLKGSTYCHEFPVTHFSGCQEDNGAYDVYARLSGQQWEIKAEFAKTLDEWPGTFNPTIPQFAASKVTSFDIGGKYRSQLFGNPMDYSFEFSRFDSGPSGSPWERQDQYVLGFANFVMPSVKLFGEYIHTDGYVPLNFISGGNLGNGVTHSESGASSDIVMLGANVAF